MAYSPCLFCTLCVALLAVSLRAVQGCTDKTDTLAVHNMWRTAYGADPYTWSDDAADRAKEWSAKLAKNNCNLEHSPLDWRYNRGENLYAIYGSTTRSCADPTAAWCDEYHHFKFVKNNLWSANKNNFDQWGHFSQVIWKGTYAVGCAAVAGDNCVVITCHYEYSGNVATDDNFDAELEAPTSASLSDARSFADDNGLGNWVDGLPTSKRRKMLHLASPAKGRLPRGAKAVKTQPAFVTLEQMAGQVQAGSNGQ